MRYGDLSTVMVLYLHCLYCAQCSVPVKCVCLTWSTLFSLQVCALKVTAGARRRILKAGGKIMTFDQLAMSAPKGQGTVLLSGESLCSDGPQGPGHRAAHTCVSALTFPKGQGTMLR